nr:(d)CMP kinase [Rappaport israeli]
MGKGTLCQALAQKLNWAYLDSGALYRALALEALKSGKENADPQTVAALLETMQLEFEYQDKTYRLLLNGQSVGEEIRSEYCANIASKIAAYAEVRTSLLEFQRQFAMPLALVADGRDMGTVVFPQADLKIYLTASAEVRAQRRFKQLNKKEECDSLRALKQEITERDARDAQRKVSPHKPAADAVIIDTQDYSASQVLEKVLALLTEKQLI